MSQDIKDQPIASQKYSVMMPCLRQKGDNRGFGMLAALTSVTRIARSFGYFGFTVPNLIRRYSQKRNNIDAPRLGGLKAMAAR